MLQNNTNERERALICVCLPGWRVHMRCPKINTPTADRHAHRQKRSAPKTSSQLNEANETPTITTQPNATPNTHSREMLLVLAVVVVALMLLLPPHFEHNSFGVPRTWDARAQNTTQHTYTHSECVRARAGDERYDSTTAIPFNLQAHASARRLVIGVLQFRSSRRRGAIYANIL